MSRTILQVHCQPDPPAAVPDPLGDLEQKVTAGGYTYLLAYADDGLIWGRVEHRQLKLSSRAFPHLSPPLRLSTLRQVHLFSPLAEWLVWRMDGGFKGRLIQDGIGSPMEYYDESLILWGTDTDGQPQDGFTPVREAEMGIRHAPPIAWAGRHCLRLNVRHYLDYDPHGAVYVRLSRLLDLFHGDAL